MVLKRVFYRSWLLLLLGLVLISNISLYHTPFGLSILPEEPTGVVVGSMIDLALISPILFMAWKRNWNWKNIIVTIAGGLVLVRFLIPMEYLEPLEAITWVGFAVEGTLLLFEVFLVVTFFKYLPSIVSSVKNSSLPVIFSFHHAVEEQVKPYPIIRAICSEMLMFFYALASWKKKPQTSANQFTLHQRTSLVAFQVMLIHAIVFETAGFHWWMHEKLPILAIILFIINIYSVIFFIGDIQAVRNNPLQIQGERIYISLGLMKRMEIKMSDIKEVIDEPLLLEQKLSKDTIEFIARDWEAAPPHVILKLKHPVKATLFLGKNKEFAQVAIRVDEPEKFKESLNDFMRNTDASDN